MDRERACLGEQRPTIERCTRWPTVRHALRDSVPCDQHGAIAASWVTKSVDDRYCNNTASVILVLSIRSPLHPCPRSTLWLNFRLGFIRARAAAFVASESPPESVRSALGDSVANDLCSGGSMDAQGSSANIRKRKGCFDVLFGVPSLLLRLMSRIDLHSAAHFTHVLTAFFFFFPRESLGLSV